MKHTLPYIMLFAAALSGSCSMSEDKGTNYYFDSANGNDANEGTSAVSAWRNLAKIKDINLAPGDSVLLKRGSRFECIVEFTAHGTEGSPIVIDTYGDGEAPCIAAPDSSLYAVAIYNSDYVTLQNIEVVNTGSQRLAGRTGVLVKSENYGTSHGITLNSLYIHDVNGSLVKEEGGGSAILIKNGWDSDSTVSVFDHLTIKNCIIRRCERNAMIWSAPWSRTDWHLSTNTLVQGNLIEGVPGDGIVPIGCDGAIIEYNLMRDCPMTLPDTEAAAGIWPWSCDNTVIRFNEVSDHKAPWDAQGFDSDYNCTNTHIEYNYSHDNDGGFVLICNSGTCREPHSVGNTGTVINYNISYGDAIRQRSTRVGTFSPTIHIAGPCDSTLIENNIFFITPKPSDKVDRHAVWSDSWDGYASRTTFRDNVFYTTEPSKFDFTRSTDNVFEGNYFYGKFNGVPLENNIEVPSDSLTQILPSLLTEVPIANDKATIKTVDKEAIERYFKTLKSNE